MPKKNPLKIKEGSWVRIAIPEFVDRVGYPRSIKYYEGIIRAYNGDDIKNLIALNTKNRFFEYNDWRSVRAFDEILQTLAWRAGHADKWGGKERTIHFIKKPEFLNKEGWAKAFKTCVTGTYSPGYKSGNYEYEEWSPPYLYNQKHHRLVQLSGVGVPNDLWIPDYHLQLIK